MDFTQFFTPAAVAEFLVTKEPTLGTDFLGRSLMPARKKSGLDLRWLKGHKGLPVSLMPSAFDAKATYRDRIGFNKIETEMPFFREGFKIKERDRQDFLRALDTDDTLARQVMESIFDEAAELRASAAVVPERMIMQLLFPAGLASGGKMGIAIQANGVDYSYDYDADGSWAANNYTALSSTKLWSATATADPFQDIKAAQDAVTDKTGSVPTRLVMNTATFNLLAKIDAVKDRYLTSAGKSFAYLSPGEVRAVLEDMTGVSVLLYDKRYKDESGNTHKFVPDGYVSLLPEGTIGQTWYGTTPEEADLMGSSTAEVSIVDTGVAITREVVPHPVNINFFASEIVLPSFERMDECACLKVI